MRPPDENTANLRIKVKIMPNPPVKPWILGLAVLLAALALALWLFRPALRPSQPPPESISATVKQIQKVNANRPALQVEAKSALMVANRLRAIPPAADWCERLNQAGRLWPVTPTNTFLALNAQVAGRPFGPGVADDTVVFFQAATPGWNQAGGPELLPPDADSVAVAFWNGRALLISREDVGKLRWAP